MTAQQFWEWLLSRGLAHRVHIAGLSGRGLLDNVYVMRSGAGGWTVSYLERGTEGVMRTGLTEQDAVAYVKQALDRAQGRPVGGPPEPVDDGEARNAVERRPWTGAPEGGAEPATDVPDYHLPWWRVLMLIGFAIGLVALAWDMFTG